MRSVSAVLRLTREQINGRGSFGAYPYIAATFSTLAVLVAIAGIWIPEEHRTQWVAALAGASLVSGALSYGVWDSRHVRRTRVADERAIRRLASDALDQILSHDFPLKPLLREQTDTLRDLMRKEPRPNLGRLLP